MTDRAQLEVMRKMVNNPNTDPALKKIQFCLDIFFHPELQQAENDRRWRILADHHDKLPEEARPKTMGACRNLLVRFGFDLENPLPPRAESEPASSIIDFMRTYSSIGLKMLDNYEMKLAPDAAPTCDDCGKEGATMRCKQCGEYYCSRACQKKGWPSHKRLCKQVAKQWTYNI